MNPLDFFTWVDEIPELKVLEIGTRKPSDALVKVKLILPFLMTKPGHWAKTNLELTTTSATSLAHRIKNGKLAPGKWDAATREGVLYIKYEGE